MTLPLNLTVGQNVTDDGITYRVDRIYGPGVYALTQIGGASPPVPGGAPIIASGDEIIGYVVKSIGLNTAPAHIAGERHIVGTNPTGIWAADPISQANMIAESDGLRWSYFEPWPLMHAAIAGSTNIWTYNNDTWVQGNTVVNNNTTTQATLPDGNYGGFTMAGGVATLNLTGTPPPASSGGTASGFGFDWIDLTGAVQLAAPNAIAEMPAWIDLTDLPSEARLSLDILTSGPIITADMIEVQFSFDGGNTYSPSIDGIHSGIKGDPDAVLQNGAHDFPFSALGRNEDDEYLWIELHPRPSATGLRYRFIQSGYFDVVTAGPVAIRIVAASNWPAGAVAKLIGVHLK